MRHEISLDTYVYAHMHGKFLSAWKTKPYSNSLILCEFLYIVRSQAFL